MSHKPLSEKIFPSNPDVATKRENFKIGLCKIVDGFITIFTCGRYIGEFSADEIGKSIIHGINHRADARKKKILAELKHHRATGGE